MWKIIINDPSGPLLAASNLCIFTNCESLCCGSWNHCHLSWLIASATASNNADLQPVASTETIVFILRSWDNSGRTLPSYMYKMIEIARKQATLKVNVRYSNSHESNHIDLRSSPRRFGRAGGFSLSDLAGEGFGLISWSLSCESASGIASIMTREARERYR